MNGFFFKLKKMDFSRDKFKMHSAFNVKQPTKSMILRRFCTIFYNKFSMHFFSKRRCKNLLSIEIASFDLLISASEYLS